MFSRRPLQNSLQTRGASLGFAARKTPSKRLLACSHLLFWAGSKTTPQTEFQGPVPGVSHRELYLGSASINSNCEGKNGGRRHPTFALTVERTLRVDWAVRQSPVLRSKLNGWSACFLPARERNMPGCNSMWEPLKLVFFFFQPLLLFFFINLLR